MNSYDIAKVHGQLSKGEVDLLKKVVGMTRLDPIIVNIGAGFGTSVAAMLEERPKAVILSVDLQVRPEERDNVKAVGLDPNRVIRILGSSYNSGLYWPFLCDLLFVDGSHSEENVKKDIDVWGKKVVDEGFILFHDYNHRNVPWITGIVDSWAEQVGAEEIGRSRYLIGFKTK